jgi:hypothetical protein
MQDVIKYRVVQDEDTGEWVIDRCVLQDDNVIAVKREIAGNADSAFIKYMAFDSLEEAEAFRQECILDTRFDISHFTEDQINNFLYNYIVNNDLTGFVFVKPLNVWTHSVYCDTKKFEFGDLSYVTSEVAFYKDKKVLGIYYPFNTDRGKEHAHSFDEVLHVCAVHKAFKPLETDLYYSKSQLELIDYIRKKVWND